MSFQRARKNPDLKPLPKDYFSIVCHCNHCVFGAPSDNEYKRLADNEDNTHASVNEMQQAMQRLEREIITRSTDDLVKPYAISFFNAITQTRPQTLNELNQLIKAVDATTEVLEKPTPINLKAYSKQADTFKGHPSAEMSRIAKYMGAVSCALHIVGIICIAGGFGTCGISAPLGLALILCAKLLLLAAAKTAEKASDRKGLSKEANQLQGALVKSKFFSQKNKKTQEKEIELDARNIGVAPVF